MHFSQISVALDAIITGFLLTMGGYFFYQKYPRKTWGPLIAAGLIILAITLFGAFEVTHAGAVQ